MAEMNALHGQFNGAIPPPKVIVGSVVGCFLGYKARTGS
jgi:hypothetical protein